MASTNREARRLRELADQYRGEGYEIALNPPAGSLPDPLRGYRADLIARSDRESVLVEVKTGMVSRDDTSLIELTRRVGEMPGWRLHLEVLAEEPAPPDIGSAAYLAARIETAERLMEDQEIDAAVLIAWSALEGAMRALLQQADAEVMEPGRRSARALARELVSLGMFVEGWLPAIDDIATRRARYAHGEIVQLSARDVVQVAEMVRYLVNDDPSVDELVAWFFDHFDDPANGVPYDSSEGGYQYIRGGPSDARDVLSEEFPDVPEAVLEAAAVEIERDGVEWVPKGLY